MPQKVNLPGFRDLFPEYVVGTRPAQGLSPASLQSQCNEASASMQSVESTVDTLRSPQLASKAPMHAPIKPQLRFPLSIPPTPSPNDSDVEVVGRGRGNDRKFPCTICAKRFARPSALETHMNSHTKNQPHKCTFPGCSKRFSARSNMQRHLRTHTKCDESLHNSSQSMPNTYNRRF
ncbi:hypothetical protein BC835DRAFT_626806 [Cytidiella melzeri]|nr:hypothetical protein BC835DRAFT_626806 [Cytidiella melzeri]